MITDLTKKAILAKLTVHTYAFRERDDERIKELAEKYHVDPRLLDLKKTTMMKEFTKRLDTIISSIRPSFNDCTLPWKDGGFRLLNVNLFNKLEKTLRDKNEELKEALETFLKSYTEFINQTKINLGDMSNNIEYPSVNFLRDRYKFEISYDPLSTTNDFRIEAGNDIINEIKKNCEDNSNKSIKNAMSEAWDRTTSVIERLYERLSAEDVESTRKNGEAYMRKPRICESLVSNIKELIELLPSFNITNDPKLESVRQEMESKFAHINLEDIKDDESYRKEKAKEAETLLNNIKDMI
jgi:hypothetical protein